MCLENRGKVVALATFPNEMEAQMAAQILEENGIPAAIQPLGGGYGALGVVPFMHHRVFVPEDDLARAKELMEVDEEELMEGSPGTSVP